MKRALDKLTNPFPIGVGAVVVTSGILLGTPVLIGGGIALWLGSAAYEYFQKPAGLAWDQWQEDTRRMPTEMGAMIRDIIREGKGISSMSRDVDISADIINSDLGEVMHDVMQVGKQARILHNHLKEWDLHALEGQVYTATGERRQALKEQYEIIQELHNQYQGFAQQLATLQAQMGAIRANLVRTSLSREVPAEVHSELVQLRDTAHSIAEGYALVTEGLGERGER
jgi:hypothetical protein